MKYLLDAHTLLWSQDEITNLSPAAASALTDPAHDRLVSIGTIWEIGIKVAIEKLSLSKPFRDWIDTAVADLAVNVLPITLEHIERQASLDATSKTGGGTLQMFVNSKPAGEGKLTRTFFRHGHEPFEVGRDLITPVDPAYEDQGVFAFTGTIEKVKFELVSPR